MAMIESSPATEFHPLSLETELATVHKLRPDIDQSIYLLEQTELPTFADTAVQTAQVVRRNDLDNKDAKYYQRKLVFTDGTRRDDIYGQANHPISDNIIDSSPAWWTALDRGINVETSARLNALGFSTHRTGIAINRAHSLYRNAWDMHTTLESLEVSFGVDTKTIYGEGDSNGAMTGTGQAAYAKLFGREVKDFYYVDPCLVQKIGRPMVKKFLLHPDYLPSEAISLGKQLIRTVKDVETSARQLTQTVELSKNYLIGNLLLTRALAWGELGHLAAHLPADQKGSYYLFDHSIANQKKQFIKVIDGSDGQKGGNIDISAHRGVHLSIVNPRTKNAKLNYFANLREH